jgi:hypothetical protein
MNLNELWQSLFGEDISQFETNLVRESGKLLEPREPLFLVVAMMVRILHSTLGETERALLRFAPQITQNAQSMIRSAVGLDQQLRQLETNIGSIETLLRSLRADALVSEQTKVSPHSRGWVMRNMGPLLTAAGVGLFVCGYILAALVFHGR